MAPMRERGQILLIGAIVIAVSIVALSVLLNGGAIAESTAREGVGDLDNDETYTLLEEIRGDSAWILTRVTRAHPSSVSDQAIYVRRNVTTLSQQYRAYYGASDSAVRIEVDDFDNGTVITQSSGPFAFDRDADSSAEPNWYIANDTRLRNGTVTVGSVTSPEDGTLVFENGSDEYNVTFENDEVRVKWPSRSARTCGSSTAPYTVDLGNGTVDGEDCPALAFGNAIGDDYDLRIVNGDQVEGSYHLTIDRETSVTGPNEQDRVYAVDLRVRQRTDAVEYDGIISIAPEEL